MLEFSKQRDQTIDSEKALMKLRSDILNAADLDEGLEDQAEQEPLEKKQRAPLGIADHFNTDQVSSAKQALKLTDLQFNGAKAILHELFQQDRISTYQEDLRNHKVLPELTSGQMLRMEVMQRDREQGNETSLDEALRLPPTLPFPNKRPRPEEPSQAATEFSSNKIAKLKDLDEEALERQESSDEERREREQPKEAEFKPNSANAYIQWAITLYSRSLELLTGKKADPAIEAKAKEQTAPEPAFNAKPQLKAPGQIDDAMLGRLLEKQKELETTLKTAEKRALTPEEEVKLEKDYIAIMKTAQNLRKDSEMISKDLVNEKQRLSEQRQDEMNKEFEKLAKRSWISKILQWVKAAATTAMIAIGIVTIATGGLGAALGLINAFLAVLAGGLQATKAVFDYQNRLGNAKITEIQYAMSQLKDGISQEVQKMQQAMEAVNAHWQMMSQAAKNRQDAGRFVITGKTSAIG